MPLLKERTDNERRLANQRTLLPKQFTNYAPRFPKSEHGIKRLGGKLRLVALFFPWTLMVRSNTLPAFFRRHEFAFILLLQIQLSTRSAPLPVVAKNVDKARFDEIHVLRWNRILYVFGFMHANPFTGRQMAHNPS